VHYVDVAVLLHVTETRREAVARDDRPRQGAEGGVPIARPERVADVVAAAPREAVAVMPPGAGDWAGAPGIGWGGGESNGSDAERKDCPDHVQYSSRTLQQRRRSEVVSSLTDI